MLRSCLCVLLLCIACDRAAPAPTLRTAAGDVPLTGDPTAGAARLDATFDGRIQLIGAKGPARAEAGQPFEATLYWRVRGDVFGDPKVFVHGQVPGAELHQVNADHAAVQGKSTPTEWRAGDVLEDTFTVKVPLNYAADQLALMVGWFEGDKRWSATPASAHDGKDRVQALVVPITGGAATAMTARAKKRTAPITIDGKLDDADWQAAARLGPFISYDGRTALENPTFARIVWDEQHLYVLFEATDKDAHTPYTKRDDPLYDSEAVEIFIDADGDRDEYVELQAAPNDLHFDAAFKGGRRKNMQKEYDVAYETKTIVDGTVNDGSDVDRGFVSEWRIPIAELRDVPHAPVVGDQWKINLFRLDRIRRGEKVVKNEASAWSSPLSGDFHNLDRFGTLVFDP